MTDSDASQEEDDDDNENNRNSNDLGTPADSSETNKSKVNTLEKTNVETEESQTYEKNDNEYDIDSSDEEV